MTHFLDKRNRRFLHLIPLALTILLGLFANHQVYYFTYMLPMLGLFYLHAFYLIPTYLQKNAVLTYVLAILFNFCGFICFYIWVELSNSIDPSAKPSFLDILKSPWPYHPIKREVLISLCSVLSISGIYAYIMDLFRTKRTKLLKRIVIYSAMLILLSLLVTGTTYIIDINWEGNASIQFLASEEYESLEEVLQLPQFKNQIVYVDLWYSSCGPCIAEFKHLPELKRQLADTSIQYLYLAHETSRPHDNQLWKNAIKKYNLGGYHLFMTQVFDEEIWSEITAKTEIAARYPHYLLIGKNGQILDYDAARPSNSENLFAEIDTLN